MAIDVTGAGDVTRTHEKWRVDQLGAGFPSTVVRDGRRYLLDNSANLHAYDAKTGRELWPVAGPWGRVDHHRAAGETADQRRRQRLDLNVALLRYPVASIKEEDEVAFVPGLFEEPPQPGDPRGDPFSVS